MKSWKTTTAGVLVAIAGALHVLYPSVFTPELTGAIITILGAAGFIASKDGNVTGGTVKQ